jgi:hypothetical protein
VSTKVRKQIYLEQRQNRQLKRLAEARGVSEASVVRELIEAEATSGAGSPVPPDRAAWEAIVAFSQQRAQSGVKGEPYLWNRDEIYEERLSRFGPRAHDTHAAKILPVAIPSRRTAKAKTHQQKTPRPGAPAK